MINFLLDLPLNVQLCKGESIHSFTDSKPQVALLKMWWKLSHCVTKVTKLQGLLSSYLICIQRCTFFVLPSQPFIYRAKCCYWSWMLTLCHWSHDFLAEGCLLSPLHRKPLEMFTSRVLCTELWRQILVMIFDLYCFVGANIKYIIRQHLSCCQGIKNSFSNNEAVIYK